MDECLESIDTIDDWVTNEMNNKYPDAHSIVVQAVIDDFNGWTDCCSEMG